MAARHENLFMAWHRFRLGWRYFWRQVFKMFSDPIFIALTMVGNGLMVVGAVVFYFLEAAVNRNMTGFLDALFWAVTTVTTVGYGNVTPATAPGKILGIVLMIAGTALFAVFTAFFANALMAPEVGELDAEIRAIKRSLSRIGDKPAHPHKENL